MRWSTVCSRVAITESPFGSWSGDGPPKRPTATDASSAGFVRSGAEAVAVRDPPGVQLRPGVGGDGRAQVQVLGLVRPVDDRARPGAEAAAVLVGVLHHEARRVAGAAVDARPAHRAEPGGGVTAAGAAPERRRLLAAGGDQGGDRLVAERLEDDAA